MVKDMILVDREALLSELRTAFDSQTADTLLSVLDKVAAQVHAAGVTREDFSELKQIVAKLAEEQRKLAEEMRKLAEAQRQSEERLSGVEERLSGVEERLSRLEETVAKLVEMQQRLELTVENLAGQVQGLIKSQRQLIDDVGKLKGRMLESEYRTKAPAYFGPLLRRPKVVDLNDLWDTLEARLSSKELNDVLLVDLVVMGKPRQQPDMGDIWLAVEVSSTVEQKDVGRALRRAELLQRVGYRAIPVVAGEDATSGAKKAARELRVVMLQDGQSSLWDEALVRWVKS